MIFCCQLVLELLVVEQFFCELVKCVVRPDEGVIVIDVVNVQYRVFVLL